jgi:hypothetical protein
LLSSVFFWSLQGHFFPSPPDRFLFPLSLIHRIITSINFGIAVVVDSFTFLSLALLRIPSLLSGPSHSLRLDLFTLFSRLHRRRIGAKVAPAFAHESLSIGSLLEHCMPCDLLEQLTGSTDLPTLQQPVV